MADETWLRCKPYVRQWQVPSSKAGKFYIVSLSRTGDWSCACPGWTTHTPRKACKHIKEAKESGDKWLLWSDAVITTEPAPALRKIAEKTDQLHIHFGTKRAITFDD